MAWAWAVVAALVLGVPGTVWLRARTMKPSRDPYDGPIPRLNRVDRWLHEHYQLGVLDRSRVNQAVIEGRELAEPRLRDAAHGLADARLTGQIASVTRKTTRTIAVAGGSVLAAILAVAPGTGNYNTLAPLIWGLPLMALAVKQSKRGRERVERARQLNEGPGRATSAPERQEDNGR